MPPIPIHQLPARSGVAVQVEKGKIIKIINTHGKQVVDFWALNTSNNDETLSMSHTHGSNSKINVSVGDTLFTNQSRPMMLFVEDTSPGVHDTLISACDPGRYRLLGAEGHHPSCAENYRTALAQSKLFKGEVGNGAPPAPLNLFMNVQVSSDGTLAFAAPTSEKGQYVCLKVLMDVVVVMSACPMDLRATNDFKPTDAQYVIMD